MSTINTIPSAPAKKYQSLYRYLRVLEGQQIQKLYKVVSGSLDPSVFTAEEIRDLENRIATQQFHHPGAN